MNMIKQHVTAQLLQSNLEDSMVPGTGLPTDAQNMQNGVIKGPVLVEIIAMSEIGHSAFTLSNVANEREEWQKSAEARAARGDNDLGDEEDLGPMPQFPRSMLHFEVSDGSEFLQAIEDEPLPDFELGSTMLGFKVRPPLLCDLRRPPWRRDCFLLPKPSSCERFPRWARFHHTTEGISLAYRLNPLASTTRVFVRLILRLLLL